MCTVGMLVSMSCHGRVWNLARVDVALPPIIANVVCLIVSKVYEFCSLGGAWEPQEFEVVSFIRRVVIAAHMVPACIMRILWPYLQVQTLKLARPLNSCKT